MPNDPTIVTPDAASDAALAYALWDSENTCRMAPDAIAAHIKRAQSVRHWLRMHGHDVVAVNPPGEIADAMGSIWMHGGGKVSRGVVLVTKLQAHIAEAHGWKIVEGLPTDDPLVRIER